MTNQALVHYGLFGEDIHTEPLGSGLINKTWRVAKKSTGEQFVLQQINRFVFLNPEDIAFNILLLAGHLKETHPDYLFVAALKTLEGQELAYADGEAYRLFPFVNGSHTIDAAQDASQAYQAAKQFGRFTRNCSGIDVFQLRTTIPDFHNLSLRIEQFEKALIQGNKERVRQSREMILFLQQHIQIAGEFEFEKTDLRIRCTHHDSKISNVLFDDQGNGICVIDLDTVMPGYFISDVGDMMRTYLSPVNEEEKDFSRVRVRPEFYRAIVDGYLSEMNGELTDFEKSYFHFAGKFMIYMQALRFLTDHLNDDRYYGSRYEGHNLVRAGNQATLLQRLLEFDPG